MDYRNQRVTIMGLGHFGGGVAAARWLAQQGASVTVTDMADENALADALPRLADVPIAALHLGGHREEDFRSADLIVINPAVRPTSPWLDIAHRSGARLRTELELFMEHCPATIVGVTGSNGKSTTAAMIASILKSAGQQTFLGGNIGVSLLEQLPVIRRNNWVVLEISSFQLWHFSPDAKMPHVAVITGCSPNHLDWHTNFADYAAAKQRILTGQTSDDFAVLNSFAPEIAAWSRFIRGQAIPLPDINNLPPLPIPGRHNQTNAACAAAAATAIGCEREAIQRGLELFSPLPQRLERFAEIEGRFFYNDSTATTPESTIAALQALDRPLWLLAGGKSKGFDFSPLASEIVHRTQGAAFFGATANEFLVQTTIHRKNFPCITVRTMAEALRWCWRQSRPGDAIVLSPACASTDQFRNFQDRGQQFADLVCRLVPSPFGRGLCTNWSPLPLGEG
jgi:UDP-N-acetylmuramoylalanine--D-glutamate ligase